MSGGHFIASPNPLNVDELKSLGQVLGNTCIDNNGKCKDFHGKDVQIGLEDKGERGIVRLPVRRFGTDVVEFDNLKKPRST